MRAHFLAAILALASSSAFAVNTCDTMPSKTQREACWSTLIGNYQAEADEYNNAVQDSKKVPAAVKRSVQSKREAISKDAEKQCRKDELGYPENNCYIGVIEKFKDFAYKETSTFGVPDMRLD